MRGHSLIAKRGSRRAAASAISSLPAVRFAKRALDWYRDATGDIRGFTLIEIAFAVEVMMLLSLISFNETRRIREHALVSACMSFQGAIQRNLWSEYAFDGDFPNDINPVLAQMHSGIIDKDFSYEGGMDPLAPPDPLLNSSYYLRCNHDHSYVGVVFVDSGSQLPPKAIYGLAAARGNIP